MEIIDRKKEALVLCKKKGHFLDVCNKLEELLTDEMREDFFFMLSLYRANSKVMVFIKEDLIKDRLFLEEVADIYEKNNYRGSSDYAIVKKLPTFNPEDKDFILLLAQKMKGINFMELIPKVLIENYFVVEKLLEANPYGYSKVTNYQRDDFNLFETVIEKNPFAYLYTSDRIRDLDSAGETRGKLIKKLIFIDKLDFFEREGLNLPSFLKDVVSENIKKDKELVKLLVSIQINEYQYISEELKKDKEFMKELISENIGLWSVADNSIVSDLKIFKEIFEKCGEHFYPIIIKGLSNDIFLSDEKVMTVLNFLDDYLNVKKFKSDIGKEVTSALVEKIKITQYGNKWNLINRLEGIDESENGVEIIKEYIKNFLLKDELNSSIIKSKNSVKIKKF